MTGWEGWAVQPTDEARAAVLASYRRARRFRDPHGAMSQILSELASRLAYALCHGTTLAGASPDLRNSAEQFEVAHDYSIAISARAAAQAERRGTPRYEAFWHHGRIGGDAR